MRDRDPGPALQALAKHAAGAAWLARRDGEVVLRHAPSFAEPAAALRFARESHARLARVAASPDQELVVISQEPWRLITQVVDRHNALGVLIHERAFLPLVVRFLAELARRLRIPAAMPGGEVPDRGGGVPPSGAPAELAIGPGRRAPSRRR